MPNAGSPNPRFDMSKRGMGCGSERPSRTKDPRRSSTSPQRESQRRESCTSNPNKKNLTWWETIQASQFSDPECDSGDSLRERLLDEVTVLSSDVKALYNSMTCRILLLGTMLWAILSTAGCVVLILWSQRVVEGQKSDARAIVVSVAQWIEAEVFHLSVPLWTLATLVSRSPGILRLSKLAKGYPVDTLRPEAWRQVPDPPHVIQEEFWEFTELAEQTVSGEISSAITYYEMSPRGTISIVSGNIKTALGLDLMRYEAEAPAVFAAIRTNSLSAVGPVQLVGEQGMGMIVHLPLFVDRSVAGSLDTREMPQVGREVVPGKNFWGFVSVVVNTTELIAKSQAAERLAFHGLRFSFSSSRDFTGSPDLATERVFYASDSTVLSADCVSVPVQLPNQEWALRVAWLDTGLPSWVPSSCAGISAGALLVAALATLLFVSHEQNKKLLYRIMPKDAVDLLAEGRQVVQSFDGATIFFSHLVGFTDLSSRSSPLEVVRMLNELYVEFDELASVHEVFKVDTIGDAYMVVGGAPGEGYRCTGPEGAVRVARFALEALELIESKKVSGIRLRAGMASGAVVAAVLGTEMPKYSFFGDTVNTASRMESTGEGGRLQVTSETKTLLEMSKEPLQVRTRAERVMVKGKGRMATHWVSRPGADEEGGGARRGGGVGSRGAEAEVDGKVEGAVLGSEPRSESRAESWLDPGPPSAIPGEVQPSLSDIRGPCSEEGAREDAREGLQEEEESGVTGGAAERRPEGETGGGGQVHAGAPRGEGGEGATERAALYWEGTGIAEAVLRSEAEDEGARGGASVGPRRAAAAAGGHDDDDDDDDDDDEVVTVPC